jgi:hypothetical protein
MQRAHAHRFTMPSESIPKLPTIAFDKRRVPQPPALAASGSNYFTVPKQAASLAQDIRCVRLLLRNSSSAIHAFVHVAVESGKAIALE